EIEGGVPAAGSGKAVPVLTVGKAVALVAKGVSASRNVPGTRRFKGGQRGRGRKINPAGHPPPPPHPPGKGGTVSLDHGVYVFPDTNAHFLGEKPQHVYSVRFAARELWGDQAAPQDSVYVDMWDDYLEPA